MNQSRSETRFCFSPLVRFATVWAPFDENGLRVNWWPPSAKMIGQTGNTVRAAMVAGEDLASRDGMIADLARLGFCRSGTIPEPKAARDGECRTSRNGSGVRIRLPQVGAGRQ